MSNRVIKDSIWTSPTLARLSESAQDHFPRWLLMTDDWGCFNADPAVIKGLCYPLREKVTVAIVDALEKEYYESGLLFVWFDRERRWGYFVSWDSHHDFCNKTNADDGGKNHKHRRKTPTPPEDALTHYLEGNGMSWNALGHLGTAPNQIRNPNPNPILNPKPIPNSKHNLPQKTTDEKNQEAAHEPKKPITNYDGFDQRDYHADTW